MTVVLTAPVEGLQPGDNYTGPNEAYHLASGNAKQDGYTGPGVSNTGAADTTIANNREFDATRGDIARGSDQPQGGTNDGVILAPADSPTNVVTGTGARASVESEDVFEGFANDPAASISSVTPSALAVAGGDTVTVTGYGFANATSVTFGGTAGTSFSVVSDREISVVAPAKAAGSYDVVVVRPQGNLTDTGAVTYA